MDSTDFQTVRPADFEALRDARNAAALKEWLKVVRKVRRELQGAHNKYLCATGNPAPGDDPLMENTAQAAEVALWRIDPERRS